MNLNRIGGMVALTAMLACAGASEQTARIAATGGRPESGVRVIESVGCGACHIIPGIRGANGLVGPPLTLFSKRTFIAGQVPNTPDMLIRWVQHPQSIETRTAMPDLGLSEQDARNVAAYLYTLR